jgi:hypothetical protein
MATVPDDARDWPAWCDNFRYEPAEEDQTAAAAMFEEQESTRLLDRLCAESLATDALTAGLEASDWAGNHPLY